MRNTTWISVLAYLLILSFSNSWSNSKPDNKAIIADPNAAALVQYSPRSLALGGISFSEPSWYNAFDINGNAMGLLQREVHGFRMMLGHNFNSLSGDNNGRKLSNNNFWLPVFFFNSPGILGSSLYYRLIRDKFEKKDAAGNPILTDMTVHNVGFNVALGLKSRYFQAGLTGHGMFGQATDEDDNEKTLIAIQKLEVGFGSHPHDLVQFGIKVGASGSFDTLNTTFPYPHIEDPGYRFFAHARERRGTIDLPYVGFFVDFGDTLLHPLLINIGMNFGKDRFWGQHKYFYTENQVADSLEYRYNPRWTNTFELNWSGMYMLNIEEYTYRPALRIGIWRKGTNRKMQAQKNVDPFKIHASCVDGQTCNPDSIHFFDELIKTFILQSEYDDLIASERHNIDSIFHEWNYWGFLFGMGYSQVISHYGKLYSEFEFNSVSLTRPAASDPKDSRGYHRILVGGEWNAHSLPAWTQDWFKLFLRASFVTGTENSNFRTYKPYQYQFFNRYTLGESSFINREGFIPVIGQKIDWSAFNIGAGFSMWESKLEGDMIISFFNQFSELVDDTFFGAEFATQFRINF